MSKTVRSRGRSPVSSVKNSSRLKGRNQQGGAKLGPPASNYYGGGEGTKAAGFLGPKQRVAPRKKGMY